MSEPLFALYGMVAFILYKGLGASAFQITLMTCCKPVVSLLSFYWSAKIGRGGRLKSSVLWAGFWMRAPFLLCPWIDSAWFVIGAAVNYMFFFRAVIPGWMEMLKRNVDADKRGRLFSLSSAIGYVEGAVLSLGMGSLLDRDPGMWKFLFFGAAAIGMLVLLVQARVPVEDQVVDMESKRQSFKETLVQPWKDSYQLLKGNRNFSRFQWGFMLCGFGIMLIQPALPIFAVDYLGISYKVMTGGISVARGLGYALSSPVWSKWIERVHISRLASWVFLSVGLFPFLMSCSIWGVMWFYLAHFFYGVGQGGSHLVWNMAGPIFSGKEESSRYTGVGLVLVGLRGVVAPPLGGFLAVILGPIEVLILGGALCFYGGLRLLRKEQTPCVT